MSRALVLRDKIAGLVVDYHAERQHAAKPFEPGVDPVPYAGRVYGHEEMARLVEASLDFWLTAGSEAAKFEKSLARFVGTRNASFCNSGSSANLIAVSTIADKALGKDRLRPGDEVITVAAGFPTTVNPIVQVGAVPVFIDIDPLTLNARVDQLEDAYSASTRAVVLAHALGNPFDIDSVVEFCTAKPRKIWLIEDNCDALGAQYACGAIGCFTEVGRTGSFGDLSTLSFYPAHHITTGEGGAVLTNSPRLMKIAESYRDWGRGCWCEPGKDNTCGKRFCGKHGELPEGYDHKFVYERLGYNLKGTDLQAAIGIEQMCRLPVFIVKRHTNWMAYRRRLGKFEEFFDFVVPTEGSEPSWFGFAMTVKESAPFDRRDIIAFLDQAKVATRFLFAGDLTRQPAYADVNYRKIGDLPGTKRVCERTFWIGVYPGLTPAMIDHVVDSFERFCGSY